MWGLWCARVFDDSHYSPDDTTPGRSNGLVLGQDYIPAAKSRMIPDILSHLLRHATTDTSCSTEPLPASIAGIYTGAMRHRYEVLRRKGDISLVSV